MSEIVLQRSRSRWYDRTRNYRVMVGGCEAARVGNGATATFAVEPGVHTVWMAIDWARSQPLEVEVSPGETVRLECGCNVKPFLVLVHALVLFHRWVWLRPAGDVRP